MATGCPPVTKVTVYDNGQATQMELPSRAELPGLASPRRTILDALLVDAAREAGAEVREGVTVTSVLRDGERVTGDAGRTVDGPFRAEGRFVVGADGRNSPVSRAVAAAYRRHEQEKGVGYYSYFAGVDFDGAYVHTGDDLLCFAFPTHDELLTVAVEWPRSRAEGRPSRHRRQLHDRDGDPGRLRDEGQGRGARREVLRACEHRELHPRGVRTGVGTDR